jgi:hypothetical protein
MRCLLTSILVILLLCACQDSGEAPKNDDASREQQLIGRAWSAGLFSVEETIDDVQVGLFAPVDVWENPQIIIAHGQCYAIAATGSGEVGASITVKGFLTWAGADIDSVYIRACYGLPPQDSSNPMQFFSSRFPPDRL